MVLVLLVVDGVNFLGEEVIEGIFGLGRHGDYKQKSLLILLLRSSNQNDTI